MEDDEKRDPIPEEGGNDAGNIELAKSLQAVLEGLSSLNDKLDKCLATGSMSKPDVSDDVDDDATDDDKEDDMSDEELAKGLGL